MPPLSAPTETRKRRAHARRLVILRTLDPVLLNGVRSWTAYGREPDSNNGLSRSGTSSGASGAVLATAIIAEASPAPTTLPTAATSSPIAPGRKTDGTRKCRTAGPAAPATAPRSRARQGLTSSRRPMLLPHSLPGQAFTWEGGSSSVFNKALKLLLESM